MCIRDRIYPKPGWVEHNPQDIYNSQYSTTIDALIQAEIEPSEIAAIGITNQRETTIVWDKDTGCLLYTSQTFFTKTERLHGSHRKG